MCQTLAVFFLMAKMFYFLHSKSGKVRDSFFVWACLYYFIVINKYLYFFFFFFLFVQPYSSFCTFFLKLLFGFFCVSQAWTRCIYYLLHLSLSFGCKHLFFHRFTIQVSTILCQLFQRPMEWNALIYHRQKTAYNIK